MAAKRLILLTVAALAGCGGGGSDRAAADSLSRDLQRIPVDSTATLEDRALPSGSEATAKPVANKPKPRPAPKPAPAATPRELLSGTTVATTVDQEISSKTNKAGETVTATVSSNVTDTRGRVVIPAGSKVTVTIAEIHESENKGDKTGKLTLTPTAVEIGGQSYALSASAKSLDWYLKDRPTNAGDIAKVGAGTAAGAVVGRVVGGNTKGAIIGGIIGGAVGTQRAVETQDRDVVVPAASRIQLTLNATFTR